MKNHPIDVAAVAAVAAVRFVRSAVVPVVALVLIVTGWQPSSPRAATAQAAPAPVAPVPVARDWAGRPLDCLTVRELRLQARAAGYRALARSGRRADLLAVLAA